MHWRDGYTSKVDGMKPERIQLKRTKGWKMPPNTVKVTRPSRWGNPFKVGVVSEYGDVPDAETAVMFYRAWIDKGLQRAAMFEIRGKNLACWCKPGEPCHADVLLEIANR